VSPKSSPTTAPPRAALDSSTARADHALFERYRDERDPVDREMLVERFLPLARKLAARYRNSHEPFDDVFQVACLGLVKAIDRFDGERRTAFSSFAVPTITGEIKRYFRDGTWMVHVPRDLQELALRVDRTRSDLTAALHREPTIAEICADVGASDEEVLEALEAAGAHTATSLEAPRSAQDEARDTLGDTISSEDTRLRRAEDRVLLSHLMRRITARERKILHLRFVADLTQAEIGERVGLSQMQVSRIIRQALARLQTTTEIHDRETVAV
jgi:RNA polymerase sigma-B factor